MINRRNWGFILVVIGVVFFSLIEISALEIQDDLHLNIQVVDVGGNVLTGNFDFQFDIATDDSCSNVVYSNSVNLNTDSRGIISYYLEATSIDYGEQYYLCYYRNSVLIDTVKIARTPYSFTAKNVNVSGVIVDSNLNMSGFNVSADYLFGDGSGITNLFVPGVWIQSGNDIYYNSGTVRITPPSSGDSGIRFDNLINGYSSVNWISNNVGYGLIAGGGLAARISPFSFWGVGTSSSITNPSNTVFRVYGNGSVYADGIISSDDDVCISNETCLSDLDSFISSGSMELLDGYDSSFFMPLNKSVYGDFDFNSGWTSGGVSIIDGAIYAQSGYFYDINALSVTSLEVNGSMIPDLNAQFDLGSNSMKWRDAWFSRSLNVAGTIVNSSDVCLDDGTCLSSVESSQDDYVLKSGDTMSGSLLMSNSVAASDEIQFYHGGTRMGEIGVQDTTWLRINQVTNKNIYTPRYIRADEGFFVDGITYGISGTGVLQSNTGATIGGHTAWHAGNDGAGSGLDADTLDGYNSSDFMLSGSSGNYVLRAGDTMTGDLIVSKTSPKIRLYDSNSATGSYASLEWDSGANQGLALEFNEFDGELPIGGYGLILGPSSTNTQFPSTGTLTFNVLGEIYAGGTSVGSLNKVWHAGNDGAGSGLDADTLDALHASSFWRADTSNSYDVRVASSNGRGLRFWDSDLYKIYMSTSADATWGGRLDATSDYNMYFRMSSGTNRGWVFSSGANNPVAQIEGSGNAIFSGTVTANAFVGDGSGLTGLTAVADGGNSDTVDGLHAASFLRSDASDTFTGKLSVGSTNTRDAGIYGIYESSRIGHIWSMGTAYSIPADGSNFGTLYGLAYKHTNNPTGGTMAGGHQAVWVTAGNPRVAIGDSGIWTSGYGIFGGAITAGGNAQFGSISRGADTTVKALAGDSYNAGFEAYGSSQGTGYLYVGQSTTYGGGVFYNGDGVPAFATGEAADRISFYRKNNNANEVVFSYSVSNNNVDFRGNVGATGTVTANAFVGDGSGLTNVDPSVNYWEKFEAAIYYTEGPVGIGASPGPYPLDIKGSSSNQDLLRLSHHSSPTTAGFMVGFNSDGSVADNVISMGVEYSSVDYDVINIKRSNRYVGIGTTNPVAQFHVSGGRVAFTGTTQATPSPGTGVLEIANSLRFDANAITTNTESILYINNNNGGSIQFDGGTLFVNSDEDSIGIGTTIPQYKTDIVNSISGTTLRLRSAQTTTGAENLIRFTTTTVHDSTNTYSAYVGSRRTNSPGSGANALIFGTSQNNGAPTQRMIIDSIGRVGVGTDSPLSLLSVNNPGDGNYLISADGAASPVSFGGGYFRGTDVGVYGSGGAYGVRGEYVNGSSYGVLGYGSYGVYGYGSSFGVYASSPYISLQVTPSGTNTYKGIDVAPGASYGVYSRGNSYDFYAAGTGVNYGSSSSFRWKENITIIDNALEKVMDLNGVYFDWNGGDNVSGHDMGFIAEEIGEIIPEIVHYENASNESNWYFDESTGEKKLYASGLDYGALTPVLVEAIKMLKYEKDLEIDKLEKTIREQNNVISDLIKRVESLEKN